MRKEQPGAVDKFGRFVMGKLRDPGIDFFDALVEGRWKAPALKQLQEELAEVTDAQRAVIRRTVVGTLDTAIHDFLFALQESHDQRSGILLTVDGENVAELSDGLQGEPFGSNGWQKKYSKHGEAQERA